MNFVTYIMYSGIFDSEINYSESLSLSCGSET